MPWNTAANSHQEEEANGVAAGVQPRALGGRAEQGML